MSNDLEHVDWREERAALPPPRRGVGESPVRWTPWRLFLAVGAGVLAAFLVISGLIVIVGGRSGAQQAEDTSVSDGGLLADLRGEDRLYRLEFTQAALGREMELLKGRLSGNDEGEFPSPSELALRLSLAELEARHGMLGGRVAELEARQMALHGEMLRLETALVTVAERFGELHRQEEGN